MFRCFILRPLAFKKCIFLGQKESILNYNKMVNKNDCIYEAGSLSSVEFVNWPNLVK